MTARGWRKVCATAAAAAAGLVFASCAPGPAGDAGAEWRDVGAEVEQWLAARTAETDAQPQREEPGLAEAEFTEMETDAEQAAAAARPVAAEGNPDAETADRPDVNAAEGSPDAETVGRLDLNAATAAELDRLPGIGPAKAKAIVAHRTANGPFERVEDIMEVKGIGKAIFADIRGSVTVGASPGKPAEGPAGK